MRFHLSHFFLALMLAGAPAWAQHDPSHHPPAAEPEPSAEPQAEPQEAGGHEGHDMSGMQHDMPGMDHGDHAPDHEMAALYGPYSMTRESSGTAWQPESAAHTGYHFTRGAWQMMLHGMANLVYDDQDGPRGDTDVFSANMGMLMASRPLGPGRFGFRTMLSAEPETIGRNGYPLLLQTGETADGVHHLVDRQHPHDLFMEIAASYSLPLAEDSSAFLYLGLPGEPALGPTAFPHRFSAMENPEAPISHHWLDSTHITFGVATLGWIKGPVKLEGSVFTGREPDQHRTDIEDPKMDSWSLRATWNPTRDWSLQASHGFLEAPEQLEPDTDLARTTLSAAYNRPLGDGDAWQTLLAWGRNEKDPGDTLDALLLESTWARGRHTFFGRTERVEEDELFEEEDPLHGRVFTVNRLSAGYIFDAVRKDDWRLGVGMVGNVALLPGELDASYGDRPVSWMAFLRVRN